MSQTAPAGKKKSTKCNIAAFDMFGSPVAFNIRGDETYKTVLGCFWTVLMILSIAGAFFWYFTIFYNKSDGEVSSTIETQDTYPKLNFHDSGFFLTVYATQNKKVLGLKQLGDSFKIEATLHIETRAEGDDYSTAPTEATPIIVPFEPCVDSGKDVTKLNGITLKGKRGSALSNDALCSISSDDKPLFVEGGDEDDKFVYFRIKIMPCDNSEITCGYYYNNESVYARMEAYLATSPVSPTVGELACSQFFSDPAKSIHKIGTAIDPATCDCGTYSAPGGIVNFSGNNPISTFCNEIMARIPNKIEEDTASTYFTLSYTEGAVTPDDYDAPFSFFLKTGAKIYGSVISTKLINMYWKEVEVNTDKGLIFENIDTQTSLSLDSVIIDTIDRGAGKTKVEFSPNGVSESVSQSFVEFTLYSSNNKLIFERRYSKLVDVFANIGGISEVVGFIVIFCYAWYNGIRMEQKLLNFGVLNKKLERDQEDLDSKKGNDDEVWEKKRHFSFKELVKFGLMEKGIGCCFKTKRMKRRQEFYEKVKESFEQRTDVINIMKGVSDVDTLKEALLTPYQLRLMHYLATAKDDDESNEAEMTVNHASEELKSTNKKLTPIQEQMDNYLKANLPANILSGDYTEPEEEDSVTKPTAKLRTGKVVPIKLNVGGKRKLTHNSSKGLNNLIEPNKSMNLMSPCPSPSKKGRSKKYKPLKRNSVKLKIPPLNPEKAFNGEGHGENEL
jgi:hypothetical protein